MAQIERGAELGSMLRHLNHFAVHNLASSNFFSFWQPCASIMLAAACNLLE
jgi:hypothetical protein